MTSACRTRAVVFAGPGFRRIHSRSMALPVISGMDYGRFLLVLLSEPRDASRRQSRHSCSVTGTVLAAPALLITQSSQGFPNVASRLRDTPARVARLVPNSGRRPDHVGCH